MNQVEHCFVSVGLSSFWAGLFLSMALAKERGKGLKALYTKFVLPAFELRGNEGQKIVLSDEEKRALIWGDGTVENYGGNGRLCSDREVAFLRGNSVHSSWALSLATKKVDEWIRSYNKKMKKRPRAEMEVGQGVRGRPDITAEHIVSRRQAVANRLRAEAGSMHAPPAMSEILPSTSSEQSLLESNRETEGSSVLRQRRQRKQNQ